MGNKRKIRQNRQNSAFFAFLAKTVDKTICIGYNSLMKITQLFSGYSAYEKRKILFRHVLYMAAIALLAFFGCPFERILHIPCPCCGVTRAWLAFFRGDLRTAFTYHALFPVLPLFLWLCLHRDARFMRQITGRRGRYVLDGFLIAFAVLLLLNHIFRMILGNAVIVYKTF